MEVHRTGTREKGARERAALAEHHSPDAKQAQQRTGSLGKAATLSAVSEAGAGQKASF